MWIIFLIVIGLLIYFIVQAQKTKGQTDKEVDFPVGHVCDLLDGPLGLVISGQISLGHSLK